MFDTRIVNRKFNLGMLGIDTDAAGYFFGLILYDGSKVLPLGKRIEYDVIAIADKLLKFIAFIGRCI